MKSWKCKKMRISRSCRFVQENADPQIRGFIRVRVRVTWDLQICIFWRPAQILRTLVPRCCVYTLLHFSVLLILKYSLKIKLITLKYQLGYGCFFHIKHACFFRWFVHCTILYILDKMAASTWKILNMSFMCLFKLRILNVYNTVTFWSPYVYVNTVYTITMPNYNLFASVIGKLITRHQRRKTEITRFRGNARLRETWYGPKNK